MEIRHAKPRTLGVDTLMYVGDDDIPVVVVAPVSSGTAKIGLAGLVLAMFATGTLKMAGGVAAAYVGYRLYNSQQ